jgi:hypothetical protein
MNSKILKRFTAALILALLVGFGASATVTHARINPTPHTLTAVAQFRSYSKNDGGVREFADDTWYGSQINSTSPTMFIGDDYGRRLWYGILDFDTSSLPDTATITDAYIDLRVMNLNSLYGNPYLTLGDMYADITSPYFGNSAKLEPQDFEWFSLAYAGTFPEAYKANMTISMQVDAGALWAIDPTQRTQFKLYFWDDNNDSLSQGITIASGNYGLASYRPLLTVYYTP